MEPQAVSDLREVHSVAILIEMSGGPLDPGVGHRSRNHRRQVVESPVVARRTDVEHLVARASLRGLHRGDYRACGIPDVEERTMSMASHHPYAPLAAGV